MNVGNRREIGIRWTIGDVSRNGFDALRLSIWGAWRLFGDGARYAVCVNSIPADAARELTGSVPDAVEWHEVNEEDIPDFIRRRLDPNMAEGAAWKLSPIRVFPTRYEISLDNDCILWKIPAALSTALNYDEPALAEDVRRSFGQFDGRCGDRPRNAGVRGIPAGIDIGAEVRRILDETETVLTSELDEQGLQVAALLNTGTLHTIPVQDISICSPFPPHVTYLGQCGAHFVGLNAKELPWDYKGRDPTAIIAENWRGHLEPICEAVGVSGEEVGSSDVPV